MRRSFTSTMWAAAFAAALTGCQGDGDDSSPVPPAATTSTTTASDDVAGIDFANGSEVTLTGGWVISPCEAGPPLFCARLDGETQATIALRTAPAASYDSIRGALDAGRSPREAMGAEAAEFVSVFEEDRPAGCGPDYRVEGFGPDEANVGGKAGIVYGFDGTQGGRHVERAVQYMALDGAELHLISINAVEDGSCMDDGELAEFTIAELASLESTLSRVIAASTLP